MDEIADLYAAGVRDFGENRPQRLWERREAFDAQSGSDETVRWHMIGPLQTNKVKRTLACTDLLHSVDRPKLLRALARELGNEAVDHTAGARSGAQPVDALLQVNVSGEGQKQGFSPDEVPAALAAAAEIEGLRIQGLMCMAPAGADDRALRAIFRRLRELRDEPALSRYLVGRELSMGMSGDFEIAVEEGATLVRIGRALFTKATDND